jgi:DNA polymerase-3 subunit delta'
VKFEEVLGLEGIKAKLRSSVLNDRLPHALLLLGPEGSGKLPLALALAQYLYCSNRTETDSCGVCSSCRKISSHTHPDIHFTYPTIVKSASKKPVSTDFIEEWRKEVSNNVYLNTEDWRRAISDNENKAPNITREETREILTKMSMKPYEGEAKTLIIWMPEYLAEQSNMLLKVIEEPPQKTYVILVAENSDRLLATITSRTQLIKIPNYTESETQNYLQQKYNLESKKAEQLAYLSEGNIRKAIELVESVEDNYSDLFRDWMLACYGNNLKKVMDITEELHKLGRVQLQHFLTNGLSILRESLLYKNIADYQIKAEADQRDFIKKFSSTLNAAYIEKSYEQINEVIYHIQRNANAKIALFNLSLNLRYNFIRNKPKS